MKNLFNLEEATQIIKRINALQPKTQPLWGTMNAPQMLAHCCVAYDMVYTDIYPRPNAFKTFLLKFRL